MNQPQVTKGLRMYKLPKFRRNEQPKIRTNIHIQLSNELQSTTYR
jgi:hypothetical protein